MKNSKKKRNGKKEEDRKKKRARKNRTRKKGGEKEMTITEWRRYWQCLSWRELDGRGEKLCIQLKPHSLRYF